MQIHQFLTLYHSWQLLDFSKAVKNDASQYSFWELLPSEYLPISTVYPAGDYGLGASPLAHLSAMNLTWYFFSGCCCMIRNSWQFITN